MVKQSRTPLVQYHCPPKLLKAFDETIKGLYGSRAAAIIEGMRLVIRKCEEERLEIPAKAGSK